MLLKEFQVYPTHHMEVVVDMGVVIKEVVEEDTVAAMEVVDMEVEDIEALYHVFLLFEIIRLSPDLVCDVWILIICILLIIIFFVQKLGKQNQ